MRAPLATGAAVLLAAGCTYLAWSTPSAPDALDLPPPPPTEHWLAADVEKTNVQGRKAWVKSLHKASPEVDTKAVEADNGRRQMAKRNALASGPRGPELGSWTERGSENQAGRMHVAAWALDGSALYAGSSKGGVWKRQGETWTPIGDNLYGGAHWLAILEPRGEVNRVVAATDGGAVHVSDDDGVTWTRASGLSGVWDIRRLAVTTEGDETLFVIGGDGWPLHYELYRSTDGGESFSSIQDLGTYAGDLWAPRTGGDTVWWIGPDGLSSSSDGGDSWTPPVATGLGETRAELAGSEAGRLWLATGGSRLYKSDNEGTSWTHTANLSDYWGELTASIVDVDTVAYGGVEFYRTTNGSNFNKMNSWGAYYDDPADKLHADIMGIDAVIEEGHEVWYIGTDGGLYESRDGLGSVDNLSLSGLRVSQYYTTHTSKVSGGIAAGAQDQGYQWSAATTGGSEDFDQLISGDYAHLVSGDGSHEYVYSVYPGFVLVQYGEDDPQLSYADYPPGVAASWLPPLAGDPLDNSSFFFCGDRLYHFELGSSGWSPTRWSDEDFASGQANYLSALAFSPLDPQLAWALNDAGKAFWSTDRGVTWDKAATLNDAHYFYGHALVASGLDADVVYAGGSGYDGPAVYRTLDGGRTWEGWDDGLPDTQVYGLAEGADGRVYAATETAAYMRSPNADSWTDITSDQAPITTYWSVEAVDEGQILRFGTYGRGIWDFEPADEVVEPTDSGTDSDSDAPTTDSDGPTRPAPIEPGCACTTGGPTASGLVALLAVVSLRRRRR